MKRFQYSMEKVLDYKQQVLDALQIEHGTLLAQVRRQEAVLRAAERRYGETNETFRRKKEAGLTAAEAQSYELGLRVQEGEIRREADRLVQLRRQAESKRSQVVGARQETASLEKLKEKKLDLYQKELRKSEEHLIDELVGAARAMGAAAGGEL